MSWKGQGGEGIQISGNAGTAAVAGEGGGARGGAGWFQ